MNDRIKARAAVALGIDGADVAKVPAHISQTYDEALKIYYPMTSCQEFSVSERGIIVWLAKKFHELTERIAKLETMTGVGMVAQVESKVGPSPVLTESTAPSTQPVQGKNNTKPVTRTGNKLETAGV